MEHELDDVNRINNLYNESLEGIVETPAIPEGYVSSFAQYTIKLKNKEERDALQAKLKEQGVPGMIYYVKPMHKQEALSGFEFDDNNFEVTNELYNTVLSLPMHPYMREEDINHIVSNIRSLIYCK